MPTLFELALDLIQQLQMTHTGSPRGAPHGEYSSFESGEAGARRELTVELKCMHPSSLGLCAAPLPAQRRGEVRS